MFYLTTHSTHFIYGYMASDIWLRPILIARKETRCRHIGYSFRLTARVLLYAPSHRQDNTYHGLCYTSRCYIQKHYNRRNLPKRMICPIQKYSHRNIPKGVICPIQKYSHRNIPKGMICVRTKECIYKYMYAC